MYHASTRRSFHGPLVTSQPQPQPTPRGSVHAGDHQQELVAVPPRNDEPSPSKRDRILAGVLAALQLLTGANQ
jgi:hypothetical protein